MPSVSMKGNFKQIMRMRDKAIQRADKATVKALDRFGAIVRQDAKKAIGSPARGPKFTTKEVWIETELFPGLSAEVPRDIRVMTPPPKPRPPGQPPKARINHEFASLRNIRFISNYAKGSVRIGFWDIGGIKYNGHTVPDLHEFGLSYTARVLYMPVDTVTSADIKRVKGKNKVVSTQLRLVETSKGKPMSFRMPKRPTMGPVFKKQKKKASKIWADYYKARRGKK